MTNDDDFDPDPVPDPDAEPTAAEKTRARAFADLVDKVVAGRPPAAMSADDRALVEVATVIRASQGLVDLPPQRKSALIEQALRGAVEKPRGHETVPPSVKPEPEPAIELPRDQLAERRARGPRAPWIVTGLATLVAAAAVLVMVGRAPRPAPPPAVEQRAELPEHHRSRPADALVGVIPQERAADASARIDAIFADRLDGYRELAFGGTP
jgi:hypothetical protein